ncbi:nuclear transport factor 2 family protein [bacterium]|nr:nuclear transport factor 2 family protein [bacterium]
MKPKEIAEASIEGLNSNDLEGFMSLFAPDASFTHMGLPETIEGVEAIRNFILETKKIFPDLTIQVDKWIVSSNDVVAEYRSHATHAETGKHMRNFGAFVWEIHQGRIQHMKDYFDMARLIHQLGPDFVKHRPE